MAGAELGLLHRHLNAMRAHRSLDLLALAAHHDDFRGGLQLIHGGDQMREHWPPGEQMQHLVTIGFHPRALAGGQDDDGEGRERHAGALPWKACHFHMPRGMAAR